MSPRISIRLLVAQSDERLLALVAQGHERAFEALVLRYRRPLLRYCRRMGLSDSRAEDVLQQSLLKAWLALGQGSQVRELKPWLYRIVHNAAVSSIRGSREESGELTDAVGASLANAREPELDSKLAVCEALGNVAALPQMQRDAIVLSAIAGQSHNDVASALGISNGAVRGLLHRARTTLRSAAATITPQSLIAWASRGAGGGAPSAERLSELSSAGSGIGVTGALLKGAVLAASAGVLAAGATVSRSPHHRARAPRPPAPFSHARAAPADVASVDMPTASVAATSRAAAHTPSTVGHLQLRKGAIRSRPRAALVIAPDAHRVSVEWPPGVSQRQGDDSRGSSAAQNHGDSRGAPATSAGAPGSGSDRMSSGSDGGGSLGGGEVRDVGSGSRGSSNGQESQGSSSSVGEGGGGSGGDRGGGGAISSSSGGSSPQESGGGQRQAGSGDPPSEAEAGSVRTETSGGG